MISKTALQAIQALAFLAEQPEGRFEGAATIAEKIGARGNYLGKLLQAMTHEGLVEYSTPASAPCSIWPIAMSGRAVPRVHGCRSSTSPRRCGSQASRIARRSRAIAPLPSSQS